MNAKEILQKARDLLAEKEWTQEVFARDQEGVACDVHSPNAHAFCALGAIARSTPGPYREKLKASRLLRMANETEDLTFHNDHVCKTKDDVLAWFDRAIVLAATEETRKAMEELTDEQRFALQVDPDDLEDDPDYPKDEKAQTK
jgi:hypothetical protein